MVYIPPICGEKIGTLPTHKQKTLTAIQGMTRVDGSQVITKLVIALL